MTHAHNTTQPSDIDYPVIGLGASAGGIEALVTFFQCMPATPGMAFVVVLHLAPDEISHFPEILQNATGMPVVQVTDAVRLQPDHIYVIAPSLDLEMADGYLNVVNAAAHSGPRIAIDLFFRTLADAHCALAIGVVLSGAGSDGALGLARIKEMGGIALVQAPDDAEHDSMPRSALATGTVDFALPVADLPQKILDLWAISREIRRPSATGAELRAPSPPMCDEQASADPALREIVRMLRSRTSHDFRQYKPATVLRRIERRMQVNGVRSLAAYRDFLHVQPNETAPLLQDMLISVTSFFRDADLFAVLEKTVLPALYDGTASGDNVRVWSAGCATGEEAYSLAIVLDEAAAAAGRKKSYQLFATDIDERAISVARAGTYPETVAGDVPAARLARYFAREGASWRIRKELREKMLFALHNVLSDPPFSRLDLVSCRNLLIYLNRDAQAEVLKMFHFALRPGGTLVLGSSESIDVASALFTVVDKKNRIFRATPVMRGVRIPLSPASGAGVPPVVTTVHPARLRSASFADIHQRALDQFAPPSVLVTRNSDIVHLSDGAGHFLRYAGGEPSHNLISVVHPELQLELRTAIFQAAQNNRSVEARRVRMVRDGRAFYVSVTVRPIHDPDTDIDLLLILFDEVEDTLVAGVSYGAESGKDPLVVQLEQELHFTRQQLRATIEQAEASTEELKASNEELQAINEELRSATEELGTGKEELQSTNEELTTVNAELQSKVEETAQINDDLQNLIASSDICTIFVDREMRIKRFTPRASDIFNIIHADVGRSLLDLTHRLDYDTLAQDAREAFMSLRRIEREVRSGDGRWYLARMTPYRTTDDRIGGAVLAFVELTGRHASFTPA